MEFSRSRNALLRLLPLPREEGVLAQVRRAVSFWVGRPRAPQVSELHAELPLCYLPAMVRPSGPVARSRYPAAHQVRALRILTDEEHPVGACLELEVLRPGEPEIWLVEVLATRPCPHGHDVVLAVLGPS